MEYSITFFVYQDLSLSRIKEIMESYELGELHKVQCVTHTNGTRQLFFHYHRFTNHYLRSLLEHYDRTRENTPFITYATVNGVPKLWYICKTLTPSERMTVHFRPIQRNS